MHKSLASGHGRAPLDAFETFWHAAGATTQDGVRFAQPGKVQIVIAEEISIVL